MLSHIKDCVMCVIGIILLIMLCVYSEIKHAITGRYCEW